MTELKRCPFCGEEIYYYFPFAVADFDGHCRNKNCFMYGIEITFGDVTKYNTRPIEDELNARIAQLTAQLAEWRADAERLIQLSNFKNKRANEYFDLHQQLVEKYGQVVDK